MLSEASLDYRPVRQNREVQSLHRLAPYTHVIISGTAPEARQSPLGLQVISIQLGWLRNNELSDVAERH